MSRAQAKKQVRGEYLREELEKSGIRIQAGSLAGLAEEAPQAYKDVEFGSKDSGRCWACQKGCPLETSSRGQGVKYTKCVHYGSEGFKSSHSFSGTWIAITSPRTVMMPFARIHASTITFLPLISLTRPRTSSVGPKGVGFMYSTCNDAVRNSQRQIAVKP